MFLVVALLISALSVTSFAAISETNTIVYLSLGDSIATGSTSRGTTNSYPKQFTASLKTQNPGKTVTSYYKAVNGATSTDLKNLLIKGSLNTLVCQADVITISIGGNNIMKAGQNFFSTINIGIANTGLALFVTDYPVILSTINTIRSSKGVKKPVRIISSTLYNPYNNVNISGYSNDATLHGIAETYITEINKQILTPVVNLAGTGITYFPVDVYTDFNKNEAGKMGAITYFYPTSWLKFLRDPHPNQTGQNRISSLHNAYAKPDVTVTP